MVIELTEEHQDTRKRLENVAFKDIFQTGKIKTNLGEELIIDMHGDEIIGDLGLWTIIEQENGDLIESRYYSLNRDKIGHIYTNLLKKGSGEYQYAMQRMNYLGIK